MPVVFGERLSAKDFNQRYNRTYVSARIFDEKRERVIFIMENDDASVVIQYTLDGERNTTTIAFRDLHIVREYPEMGASNHGSCVILSTTHPDRQWRRGLCSARTWLEIRPKEMAYPLKINHTIAEQLFNREYIPYAKGMKAIDAGRKSAFAMSKEFWISGTEEKKYLWRNRAPLGEIINDVVHPFDESYSLYRDVAKDWEIVRAS